MKRLRCVNLLTDSVIKDIWCRRLAEQIRLQHNFLEAGEAVNSVEQIGQVFTVLRFLSAPCNLLAHSTEQNLFLCLRPLKVSPQFWQVFSGTGLPQKALPLRPVDAQIFEQ